MTRNVLYLFIGQVITAAIAFAVSVSIARHLGARDYGILFLSSAFVSLPLTFAELGQNYYAVSTIARDRTQLGAVFGTGFALRLATAPLVFLPLVGVARLIGYADTTLTAIAFTALFAFVGSLSGGISVVLRGLERMDYEAAAQVTSKALYGVASLAAVALGAGVVAVIQAQVAAGAVWLLVGAVFLHRLHVPRPRVRIEMATALARGGAPFLAWSSLVAIQQTVDPLLLSKLAPEAVVGWYGAASRLVLVVMFPAGIIAAALYPTLSRLFVESPAAFRQIVRSGVKWVLLLGGLAAVGTYLFSGEVVAVVYGERDYGRAAEILRILSVLVLALFLNFVVGTAVMAANRQKPFIYLKATSVLTLAVLNGALIPVCQRRFGNGGLGSAAAAASAELVLLSAALMLLPAGTLDVRSLLDIGRVLAGALSMVAVKHLLGGVHLAIGISATTLAYLAAVIVAGGIRRRDAAEFRDILRGRSEGEPPSLAEGGR